MKKLFSVLLVLTLFLSFGTPVFAEDKPAPISKSNIGTTNSLNTQKAVSDAIGLGILGLLMGEIYVGVTAARLSGVD